MRVAYISILAQFPNGLDLHVRNAQWALSETNHQLYIFTRQSWRFDQTLYPSVKIVESPDQPMKYHQFWPEVTEYIDRNCTEDVFIFKQHDMLFHRKIGDLVGRDGIVLSNEKYHPPIMRAGVPVYPYVWEGGSIVPSGILLDAIRNWKIDLNNKVTSPVLQRKLVRCDGLLSSHGRNLRWLQDGHSLDNFGQFCLYCFFNQVPVTREDFILHFPRLEATIVNYKDFPAEEALWMMSNVVVEKKKAGLVFLLSLCGYLDTKIAIEVLRQKPTKIFQKLRATAAEWMSSEQLARFKEMEVAEDLTLPRR